MEQQDKIVNTKMLQSFKQLFDSKTSPDTMSHLILSTVFVVSLIGALILLLLPSYSNIQCATSFIFKQQNNHVKKEDSAKTPDDDFGTSMIWRGRQKTALNPELEKEALVSLNVAMDMYAQGKNDKALKLFQHAIALDPKHADILNEYGEFIEKYKKDIVLANHLYCKALIASPTHSKALANSERTLPLVEEIDQNYFNRIDNKRAELYKIPANHPGLRRAKKEAYFLHIYHTNAIEGNTLTLQQTRAIVETKMAVGGKSLQEQSEVVGIDSAMSFMNNSLLGKVGQLSLNDILEIHKRVLGYVDPIEAGRIRRTQVFVGNYRPPHPKEVEKLMHEFISWLNSEEASKIHPIEYAALAHYKLVSIHPFYDGNGRTSRLLMNLILMQAGFPPVSIKVEDRFRYYDTLELANEGDIRPFIRFIAECAERTLDEFLLATVENPSSHETLSLTSIPNSLYSGHQQMVILAQP